MARGFGLAPMPLGNELAGYESTLCFWQDGASAGRSLAWRPVEASATSGRAVVTIGPQCWRNTMTVPECMLSVYVEGCKNESTSYGRAAAV